MIGGTDGDRLRRAVGVDCNEAVGTSCTEAVGEYCADTTTSYGEPKPGLGKSMRSDCFCSTEARGRCCRAVAIKAV